jgi:hypothetical protein
MEEHFRLKTTLMRTAASLFPINRPKAGGRTGTKSQQSVRGKLRIIMCC